MSNKVNICLLLVYLGSGLSTKILIDNPGFDDPQSWQSEYLPCSLDEVVFPKDYDALLPLPSKVDISGLILPENGAILLHQDSVIELGGDHKGRECDNDKNGKANLKIPQSKKWFNPGSWKTVEKTSTTWIPDIEGVPCSNESVIIQANGPLSIDLESVNILTLGQLSIAGSLISKADFIGLLHTVIGEFLFKRNTEIDVRYYRDHVCGCLSYDPFYIGTICHNVQNTCKQPHCLTPVKPLGSCCDLCGSVIRFEIDFDCNDEIFYKLSKIIADAIKEENLSNYLDFHVQFLESASHDHTYLQAVVTDRETYSEQSVSFVKRLKASKKLDKLYKTTKNYITEYSGKPHNPNITFGSIVLIILCFLFVCIVTLVIFSHYAPNNRYVRNIPIWIQNPRSLWRSIMLQVHTPFVFARFDNAGGTDSIEIASDRQINLSMTYDATTERAFDNPMFVEEPKTFSKGDIMKKDIENKPSVSTDVKLENLAFPDNAECDEEQELTEIRLENLSESSDDDTETEE